jgi:hypothetical protein
MEACLGVLSNQGRTVFQGRKNTPIKQANTPRKVKALWRGEEGKGMILNPINAAEATYSAEGLPQRIKQRITPQTQTTGASAQLEISDLAHSYSVVRAAISKLPEVRIEIVKRIQEKISQNDYPMDNKLLRAFEKTFKGNAID